MSLNLVEFADAYYHPIERTRSLRKAPLSSRLAETYKEKDWKWGNSFLSTSWWQVAMKSEAFIALLSRYGMNEASIQRSELMIVTHDDGHAHNLMILDPTFSASAPVAIQGIDLSRDDFERSWAKWRASSERYINGQVSVSANRFTSLQRYQDTLDELGADELYQIGDEMGFQILISKLPEQVYTHTKTEIASAAIGVSPRPGTAPTSTVGAAVIDKSGRSGVTICLHAIEDAIGKSNIQIGKTLVEIGGEIGIVQSVDPLSDSCFVEVDLSSKYKFTSAEPLAGKSPRNEDGKFSGLASGAGQTAFVQSWSPDIPIYEPRSQLKVFTDAVTNPGDSGAPLLDSDGHIIGFSFYRTMINKEPSFSCWIWADSVFQSHNLI
jgi:hypothetical protein